MPSQSFPELAIFLENLKNGFRNFSLRDIHDLLTGRPDHDFLKKTKQKQQFLNKAIKEIQVKCGIRLHRPPDLIHVKLLLWREISGAVQLRLKGNWDTDQIGESIVAQLLIDDEEQLECIPLFDSVAPLTKEPKCYRLANGVWLFEPTVLPESLLARLEGMLKKDLPKEIEAELNRIGELWESEYGALLYEPIIAILTMGSLDNRVYTLRQYVQCLLWPEN